MTDVTDLDTTAAEVTDFDVQSAMTNMQNLKSNLSGVIQELYALDTKER